MHAERDYLVTAVFPELRDEHYTSKDIWHQVLDSFSGEVLAFAKTARISRWANIALGESRSRKAGRSRRAI